MNPGGWASLLGLAAGALAALAGLRLRLLSVMGAIATGGVLAAAGVLGGWPWAMVLLAYWLSGALCVLYRRADKARLGERFIPARAGAMDVLGRLGWPLALAACQRLSGYIGALLFVAFVGAVAASAADVAATEIGVLSAQHPRLITAWRRTSPRLTAPPGTPGAVSMLGLVAALGAAWFIGLAALASQMADAWWARRDVTSAFLWLPLAGMFAGALASLVDSFLGATAQGMYYCEACGQRSEQHVHTCGRPTRPERGWPWLDNDGVNLVGTLVGAALAVVIVYWLAQSSFLW